MISVLLHDVVIVDVMHQSPTDMAIAYFAIYWLLKDKLTSPHVDCNKVFIKYCALLEVWFCCKFQCFLVVVD